MEMCANDSNTFVGKGRYHLEEQVEVNPLGPRTGGGSGQITSFHHRSSTASYEPSTTAKGSDLAAEELPHTSAPSKPLFSSMCSMVILRWLRSWWATINEREEERAKKRSWEKERRSRRKRRRRGRGKGRERQPGNKVAGVHGTTNEAPWEGLGEGEKGKRERERFYLGHMAGPY